MEERTYLNAVNLTSPDYGIGEGDKWQGRGRLGEHTYGNTRRGDQVLSELIGDQERRRKNLPPIHNGKRIYVFGGREQGRKGDWGRKKCRTNAPLPNSVHHGCQRKTCAY